MVAQLQLMGVIVYMAEVVVVVLDQPAALAALLSLVEMAGTPLMGLLLGMAMLPLVAEGVLT